MNQHTDHLGIPKFATNTGGTQVWANNGDAFGVGTSSGSVTVNLRFPGQYFDDESDLHYNWNRYYNPAIGRYISSDPIGLEGGLNTFSYVDQSPLMYSDIMGLKKTVPAPIFIPPIAVPGTPENDQWTEWALQNTPDLNTVAKYCIDTFRRWHDPVGTTLNEIAKDKEESAANDREKNCIALRDSILATCASLSGEKARRCRFAAQDAYDQCMED